MQTITHTSRTLGATLEPGQSAREFAATVRRSAGLGDLKSLKDACLGDPGTSVFVEQEGNRYVVTGQPSDTGWLVIKASPGHLSATHFETDQGAMAQVWAISAMQDSIFPQVNSSMTAPTPDSRISFTATGPNGETSVTAVKL
jgi:hypothetical protein